MPQAALDAAAPPRTRALAPRAQDAPPLDLTVDQGGFVAFYAAQSNEATPEKRLPRGKPGRRSQGVFTFTLFEALARNPGLNYRQLGQEILRRYATEGRARSTPMFVGDLDRPVFARPGAEGTVRVAQWPVTPDTAGMTIAAGRLHGLAPGTRLALLTSPADDTGAAIGFLEVDEVANFSALARITARDGTREDAMSLPEALPGGLYARQMTRDLDFAMQVALPGDAAPGDARAALQAALDLGRAEGMLPTRLTLAPEAPAADARIRIDAESGDLLISTTAEGGAATGGNRAVRITTGDKTVEELGRVLADSLSRMARVRNLLRLAGSYGAPTLEVEIALRMRQPEQSTPVPLPAIPVPRLIPGDEVHISARNDEARPVDLNVLYIGSDYSITHMFKGRLHPGDRLQQGLLRITDEAFGRDRVLLLLTPAERHSALADFGFLAQEELPRTRAASGPEFDRLLAEAGFGERLRAAVALGAPEAAAPRPMMLQFDIDTRPAP